jgi:hypothetical protein
MFNGRRLRMVSVDQVAVARQHGVLAGLSAGTMTVLTEIKPEHIAEMTYLDDWDTSVNKLGAQGGLFIVLKPGIAYESGRGSYVLDADPKPSPAGPVAAPATLPAYRHRLLGVFDSETGDPIEGAYVIDLTSGTKARTTATGTVTLAFLPEGGSPVRIMKDGYEELTLAVEISSEHLDPLTLLMARVKPPPR